MRSHGINKGTGLFVRLGYNWCMDEFSAIVGLHQLERLESFIKKRQEIAEKYDEGTRKISGVKPFFAPSNIRHSYWKYPLYVDDEIDPVKLAALLKSDFRVNTGNVYYPPIHLHPVYREVFGHKEGELPVSERVLKRVVTLPMHVQLTDLDIKRVLNGLEMTIPKACNS